MIKELKNIHNISDDEITFSDYVITRLLDHGVSTVFGLTGGGIMYLIDSLARNSDCKLITVHHESFGGLAADAYSKVGNNIGVALGTTGPGVTNLFTSITAAWQDSSRVLFIGGQVKTADSSRINNLYVRQNGTFEFDAIDTYKHVTKYCEIIDDAEKGIIKLEEAITALNHNRPGPSYIEIPLDIQGKKIKIDKIKQIHSSFKSSYDAEITKKTEIKRNNNINIYTSNSPLFIIGAGVLKSNSSKKLRQFLLKHSLPYVVTPLAIGFSNSADKNYLGVLSIRGNRSANIVSQQASSIIVIGCSLHQQIVGWDPKLFNPDAKKTWFEIDKNITDLRSEDLSIDNVYNIDIDEAYNAINKSNIFEENDYFTLFEFSAKWDPVPTMLTQNHVSSIKGFYGQTTAYQKDKIKQSVVILAEAPGRDQVKYIHGNFGKGTFTFYAGHDPEDYTHRVDDPPTDLGLYPNSPGYRLILNNILFPAAQKKKRKT